MKLPSSMNKIHLIGMIAAGFLILLMIVIVNLSDKEEVRQPSEKDDILCQSADIYESRRQNILLRLEQCEIRKDALSEMWNAVKAALQAAFFERRKGSNR